MTDAPILSILTFLPLVGVVFILVVRGAEETVARNARNVALWTTVITFAVSLILWFGFNRDTADFQYVEQGDWLSDGIRYQLGIDGISMLFVLLSTLLMPLCILASWRSITTRVREYMIAFLVMETLMIGVFTSLDMVMFFIFYEASLIPMFLIIGVWGGKNRVYAALKFFMFTFAGSVLLLLAIIYMYYRAGTTDIPTLMEFAFTAEEQNWLWIAFFVSFAVKVPIWPLHTWLPDAHVEAPTAGSVLLAGVLLKFGGYGLLRFSIPIFPLGSDFWAPLILVLSIISIIYTSMVALVQEDMKKVIAYSSIAHMGVVKVGMFSFTIIGIQGAIILMLAHGFISGALFLCVGVLYDQIHTRDIGRYGGAVNRMPMFAFVFMLFIMASIGLPGLGGFRRRVPLAGRRLQGEHLDRLPGDHLGGAVGGLLAMALPQRHVRRTGQAGAYVPEGPQHAGDPDLRAPGDPGLLVRPLSAALPGCDGCLGSEARGRPRCLARGGRPEPEPLLRTDR